LDVRKTFLHAGVNLRLLLQVGGYDRLLGVDLREAGLDPSVDRGLLLQTGGNVVLLGVDFSQAVLLGLEFLLVGLQMLQCHLSKQGAYAFEQEFLEVCWYSQVLMLLGGGVCGSGQGPGQEGEWRRWAVSGLRECGGLARDGGCCGDLTPGGVALFGRPL
jgi:hypothetical protein